MLLSVIVPALDEERALPGTLAALAAQDAHPFEVECLVVDGGSRDGTVACARAAGAAVVTGERGRGAQLRAGARVARGDVLLFLHADVLLPPDALAAVAEALADPRVGAGAFAVEHRCDADAGPFVRACLRMADRRSRTRAVPYGDQALFCRRAAYDAAGGIPDRPLLEDVAFARRLRAVTRLARLPRAVFASGRRFERRPVRTALCWWLLPPLDRLGLPARIAARLYGAGPR